MATTTQWIPYTPARSHAQEQVLHWYGKTGTTSCLGSLNKMLFTALGQPTALIIQYAPDMVRLRAGKDGELGVRVRGIGPRQTPCFTATALMRLLNFKQGERWLWHPETEDGVEWIVAERPGKEV